MIGYITLTCSEIELHGTYPLQDFEHADRYASIPALKNANLDSHAEYAGNCIGRVLIEFAIAMAADHIAQNVGCRFLIKDAKARSVEFYEKNGMTLLDTGDNRARCLELSQYVRIKANIDVLLGGRRLWPSALRFEHFRCLGVAEQTRQHITSWLGLGEIFGRPFWVGRIDPLRIRFLGHSF